eukprot:173192-Hanusia_phi.AAC.3
MELARSCGAVGWQAKLAGSLVGLLESQGEGTEADSLFDRTLAAVDAKRLTSPAEVGELEAERAELLLGMAQVHLARGDERKLEETLRGARAAADKAREGGGVSGCPRARISSLVDEVADALRGREEEQGSKSAKVMPGARRGEVSNSSRDQEWAVKLLLLEGYLFRLRREEAAARTRSEEALALCRCRRERAEVLLLMGLSCSAGGSEQKQEPRRREELNAMKVTQLRELLASRRVAVSGKKAEL